MELVGQIAKVLGTMASQEEATQRLTFLLAMPSAKVHTAQQEDHQNDQQDTTNTSYSYADDCFGGQ